MSESKYSEPVNEEIYSCLSLEKPKSFFLFAGAGSGKTRSLVEVLKKFRDNNVTTLKRNGQKVAIITYTNAACDEIKRRLDFDSAFHVSTIHSFAWELIFPYTKDISNWLKNNLEEEISDLETKQAKARSATSKTYIDRAKKIHTKQRRRSNLDNVQRFTYNPNGDNLGKYSLNHAEVISIAAYFIHCKKLMQNILVKSFPILLIDESQDTKKDLIQAFFELQKNNTENFCLGMFGDMMQRIYADGQVGLGDNIPEDWAKPNKAFNYRCPKRVVTLINKIRSDVDGQEQIPSKVEEGVVRLFIVDAQTSVDKLAIENKVISHMLSETNDEGWGQEKNDVKILTLEHHMAATRGGFSDFFAPLHEINKYKTGLLDGSLSGITFFSNKVIPVLKSLRSQDKFSIAKYIKENSRLLDGQKLKDSSDAIKVIREAEEAVNDFFELWSDENEPTMKQVLQKTHKLGLFDIPDVLVPLAESNEENVSKEAKDEEDESDPNINAWEMALSCPFSQFENYLEYISEQSRYGTHQGVKGLEFPRVMVVLDDDEARGFLFSYEKLFQAKELSKTDLENQKIGKETGVDRTKRLFYVACSRAEDSLAIIAFTKNPHKVKEFVLNEGWFLKDEIVTL